MEGSTGLIPGPLLGMWLRSRWVGAWWEDRREEGEGCLMEGGERGDSLMERRRDGWIERQREKEGGGGGVQAVFTAHVTPCSQRIT